MKLFIHEIAFEKFVCEIIAFCPGRTELNYILLYLFLVNSVA